MANLEAYNLIKDVASDNRIGIAAIVHTILDDQGFTTSQVDAKKPWGIEVNINESQAGEWLEHYFDDDHSIALPYGPKLMLLGPGKRLSWHAHERKDAYLKVLAGPISATVSETDFEPEAEIVNPGSRIHVPSLIRHRLGGLSTWGAVAEISRNVFPNNPSDAADTRRISDDYNRAS